MNPYLGNIEIINPSVQKITKENSFRFSSDTNVGLNRYLGNCLPKTYKQQMDLIRLNEVDLEWLARFDLKLKPNEIVCRFQTKTTLIGHLRPLVKINVLNLRAYFMEEGAADNEEVVFVKKGIPLQWLNLATEELI